MNVFNEFSCSMNNRANVYVTVMFKLYSLNSFQCLTELHSRSLRIQHRGTKHKHTTKYLNKNELMDSHPV